MKILITVLFFAWLLLGIWVAIQLPISGIAQALVWALWILVSLLVMKYIGSKYGGKL